MTHLHILSVQVVTLILLSTYSLAATDDGRGAVVQDEVEFKLGAEERSNNRYSMIRLARPTDIPFLLLIHFSSEPVQILRKFLQACAE